MTIINKIPTNIAGYRDLITMEYSGVVELPDYNCAKYNLSSGEWSTYYSPYFDSFAGKFLLHSTNITNRSILLRSIYKRLINSINSNGLIGFCHPNYHRYDIDTLVCVYSFLYRYDKDFATKWIPKILPHLNGNKYLDTGAYCTWFDKTNNNIDYMVNLNIREFYRIINFNDPELDNYLHRNLERFVLMGSIYYKDISIAAILSHLFLFTNPWSADDFKYKMVLKNMISSFRCRNIFGNLVNGYYSEYINFSGDLHLIYCNSKDSVYYSYWLDKIVCRYIINNIVSDYSNINTI